MFGRVTSHISIQYCASEFKVDFKKTETTSDSKCETLYWGGGSHSALIANSYQM